MEIKRMFSLLVSLVIILEGCNTTNSQQDDFNIWIDDSTSTQETKESAIERLNNANIDYKVDDEGNILIKESDIDKAVICCS
ncbi:hypothetical protein [Bacillus solimangrovi]|uniref:Uncharacterized protein n=1 Tax=Bacillus solimangrovi TaxID=1305675 RepID=A0A1E5LE50_9BACI|nr:hypothetical protein [Bacillus solimangrovi]OEH92371.1 hypothetical protein BFG57_16130 [Bacillus solimangrovi]